MSKIELRPILESFTDVETAELEARLKKLGAPKIPGQTTHEVEVLADDIDEVAFEEFLERLPAHGAADADLYIPIVFEGTVESAYGTVGSAQRLSHALKLLAEELEIERDEDDEEEEKDDDEEEESDEGDELIAQRKIWRVLTHGAKRAVKRGLQLALTR